MQLVERLVGVAHFWRDVWFQIGGNFLFRTSLGVRAQQLLLGREGAAVVPVGTVNLHVVENQKGELLLLDVVLANALAVERTQPAFLHPLVDAGAAKEMAALQPLRVEEHVGADGAEEGGRNPRGVNVLGPFNHLII